LAIMLVNKNPLSVAEFRNFILNEYQELTNISRQTATIDLSEMVKKNVFERIGKVGKGIAYLSSLN